MRVLNWLNEGKPVGPDVVAAIEAAISIRFPSDLVEFVRKHSGASNPDECEFQIFDHAGRRYIGNFGGVLAFDGLGAESVLRTLSDLGNQLPSGIVPVVKTGSGDYVCLDYRTGRDVAIVYFAHEKSGQESLIAVAPTFTDFLNMLAIPKD